MLLIFGLKGYARQLAIVMLVGQNCGTPAAHRVEEHTRKFTLFFIPLFRVSRKYVLTCTFCAQTTVISAAQAEHYVSMGPGTPATIESAPRS
jgi:hypothetical protein